MSNERAGIDQSGFLLINKTSGPTSHDIADQLRKITGIKKIGHSGTLDPFARGLLIVGIGRLATKKLGRLSKLEKTYRAVICLGFSSDTYDPTGSIIENKAAVRITRREIGGVLSKFVGPREQIPPMYSAKKVKGRKLYELARAGIIIERAPVPIYVYRLDFIQYRWPFLEIEVECSSGTYIRSLANDIGEILGCGAYLKKLNRIAIGPYTYEMAAKLTELDHSNWTDFLIQDIF